MFRNLEPAPTLVVADWTAGNSYLAYQFLIISRLLEANQRVTVLDLSRLHRRVIRTYPYDLVPLFGPTSWFSLWGDMRSFLLVSGVPLEQARPVKQSEQGAVSDIQTIGEIKTAFGSCPLLAESIESTLVTEVLRAEFASSRRVQRSVRKLFLEFRSAEVSATQVLQKHDCEQVVVLNGRFPHQAGVVHASRVMEKRVLLLEHGGSRGDDVHLDTWAPNDRKSFQRKYLEAPSNGKLESVSKFLDNWFQQRADTKQNPFARHFASGTVANGKSSGSMALFLTSSPDEFVGLGDSWRPYKWTTQVDAFREVMHQVSSLGYETCLRMHPNGLNKSWAQLLRETSSLRALKATCTYESHEQVSTYSLIESASVVFVWGSTAGLEAAAMGKPVYVLGPALYDEIAPVRRWPEPPPSNRAQIEFQVDIECAASGCPLLQQIR